ncbi:LEC14B protein-like [Canna indica]|uniref:LEC14B protein-like n=1 Tax=Canna indica TaxID=4628 RepID=A0AAQ3KA32_9LILI|nr:LEC14B protein-like [Canna indica]
MGYGMSRLDMDVDMNDAPGFATSSRRGHSEAFDLDNEIFHLTRLRSEPSSGFKKAINAGQNAEISTARMLWAREANASGRGRFSSADCSCVLGQYLPVNGPWPVDRMDSRVYVSQFSVDGSLFVAAFQGSRIKIYNVDDGWNVQKDIRARSLRWTITDTSLSPDNQYLVYASMMPIVHIVKMGTAATESHANITEVHEGLDFSMHEDVEDSFGIFSVKFSSDGRELLAGSNDSSIYVYDLEANKLQSRFPAHLFDVNTVAFADETGNVVYSGSDDTLCKVWDRRCSVMDRSAAGVLSGHLEGITFIDSRGDGRYLISNGKDQAIKLWDIRKMSSSTNCDISRTRTSGWDYRYSQYPPLYRHLKHPDDQSVATYRGHSVLRTLIRCYFSPYYSTGQKYIYTGSHDTSVYIYDVVSGDRVARLQCHQLTVRDCSWHPYYPLLVSSSWDGQINRWEYLGNDVVHATNNGISFRGSIEDQMFRVMYL